MPGRRASAWLPEQHSHLEQEGAGLGTGSHQGRASKLGPGRSPGSPAVGGCWAWRHMQAGPAAPG